MTRLDTLAAELQLAEAQRRLAFAPKGAKRQRQAELDRLMVRMLKQDVRAARKRRRG
jgi:hypothetical protein